MGNTQSKMLPTDADFDKVGEPVLKWRDLPVGKYIIKAKKPFKSQFGDGMKLILIPFEGTEAVEVWACMNLVKDLLERSEVEYIRHEGLKQSGKNETQQYFSYSLL